jgi:hypothetical protein
VKPIVSVVKTSFLDKLQDRLKKMGKRAVYVGIPAASASSRAQQLSKMSLKAKGGKRKLKLIEAVANTQVSNAELLYIFSKGSLVRKQPPRPVLEPAIEAEGNKEAIAHEIVGAMRATLEGKESAVLSQLKRAGTAGQNAARGWFTDSRNHWAPNAPSTIAAKGSDTPGIDTGAMRASIVYVVED